MILLSASGVQGEVMDKESVLDIAAALPRNQSNGIALVVVVGAKDGSGSALVDSDDPPEVVLTLPAIERYHFESWSGLWYWDATT